MRTKTAVKDFKKKVGVSLTILLVVIAATMCFIAHQAIAETTEAVKLTPESARTTSWAFLSAAIAAGVSAVAAGIAVGYVGAAAVGAISEKPEVAGRALIFVGLAEGIAIYGLIIAIMILGKV